jgi:hypothetical protein
MELEKLTKSQIVLLTLLVSFVTSIATGIVTVSLMEDAPPTITQTVNRIVERTVETVAPSQPAAVATIEKEVLVSESEQLARAIERVAPSVVRLYVPGKDESGNDIRVFVGHAVVASSDGALIADAGTPDGSLTALRADSIEVPVNVAARPEGSPLIRLQASAPSGSNLTWEPATFLQEKARLAAPMIAIGGRTGTRVAQGIVTGFGGPEKDGAPSYVETDIASDTIAVGSPLVGIDGSVRAIATGESRQASSGAFLALWTVVLDNVIPRSETGA